jgi:hypothetical protein
MLWYHLGAGAASQAVVWPPAAVCRCSSTSLQHILLLQYTHVCARHLITHRIIFLHLLRVCSDTAVNHTPLAHHHQQQ